MNGSPIHMNPMARNIEDRQEGDHVWMGRCGRCPSTALVPLEQTPRWWRYMAAIEGLDRPGQILRMLALVDAWWAAWDRAHTAHQ